MSCSVILALVGIIFAGACSGKIADGSTDGAAIFVAACARCHGERGQPTKGMMSRTGVKSLKSERIRSILSDAQIRTQILNGSESRSMPAFQGALSEEQLASLVAYVRALAKEESGAKEAPGAKDSGRKKSP